MKRQAKSQKSNNERREVDGQLRFRFYAEEHGPKATLPHPDQIGLRKEKG